MAQAVAVKVLGGWRSGKGGGGWSSGEGAEARRVAAIPCVPATVSLRLFCVLD